MRVRPGRLLPSVMVGGLLVSGLALGAGAASAATDADQCYVGSTLYRILVPALITKDGDNCKANGSVLQSISGLASGLLAPVADAGNAAGDQAGNGAGSTPDAPSGTEAGPGSSGGSSGTDGTEAGTGTGNSTGAVGNKPTTTTTAPRQTAPAQAPVLAGPPAALPPAAPPALGAAGPVGALPPLAGVAPAGLASNLFSANAYDPGLLFGTPLGNAASALFSPKADSAVTTVSQAQLLPSAGSGGFGTPATIGVIILACLIGFAVRHRVISRMKKRELPAAEYQPRHAAVETEPEVDPATELHAPDEARTLVVLSRR